MSDTQIVIRPKDFWQSMRDLEVDRLAHSFVQRGVSSETAREWAEAETPVMRMITISTHAIST